jgi:hypothetical protein
MNNTGEHLPPQPQVQVFLDGQRIELPGRTLESLAAVRAQLELIALRQDRVLAALAVDGVIIPAPQAVPLDKNFRQVQAQTISFQELGQHMAAVACKQVQALQARVEAAAALVLINEWPGAQRLASELEAGLRAMLILISFMHELCGNQLAELTLDRRPLAHHLERLGHIRHRWEVSEAQQDLFALSDVLVQYLAPWLQRLGQYLEKLNER